MKSRLVLTLAFLILLFSTQISVAQTPDLATASGFAVFTAAGAFSNEGATFVTGDVGTYVGAFTGFPPGIVIGQIHVADSAAASAATDVDEAFSYFSGLTCGSVIGTTLGNNQLLTPNIYCLGAASTLNGNLTLDGEGNPNAIFIFKIDGALSTTNFSNVNLINGASVCNVYWQINGAVELGDSSVFRGTIVANGAISLLEGASLFGRALSRTGAVSLHNNIVTIPSAPTASVITANGATTFCAGGSVVLSGNVGGIWSNGSTSSSITVNANGDYFVTNSGGCGNAISNHITVVINQLPNCMITGNGTICSNTSVQLCATPGMSAYHWSTGATTQCIMASTVGNYYVTITNANGCTSACNKPVTTNSILAYTNCVRVCVGICNGTSTVTATGGTPPYTYNWSTGATTQSINNLCAGVYWVTLTDANGCKKILSGKVSSYPVVSISGTITKPICGAACTGAITQTIAGGGSTIYSYLWSDNSVSTKNRTGLCSGTYTVTVTSSKGCTGTKPHVVTCQNALRADEETNTEPAIALAMIANIYPNPNTGQFNLSIDAAMDGYVTVKMIDMIGRVVLINNYEVTNGNNTFNLDMSDEMASASYTMVVTDGKNVAFKLIAVTK